MPTFFVVNRNRYLLLPHVYFVLSLFCFYSLTPSPLFFTHPTHTMACFVKRTFYHSEQLIPKNTFCCPRFLHFPPSSCEKKNVIFYHTRVFLYTCFVRRKENEIYCILEVIYIYIIYMLLYTHVLPQSCLIPWYRFT